MRGTLVSTLSIASFGEQEHPTHRGLAAYHAMTWERQRERGMTQGKREEERTAGKKVVVLVRRRHLTLVERE